MAGTTYFVVEEMQKIFPEFESVYLDIRSRELGDIQALDEFVRLLREADSEFIYSANAVATALALKIAEFDEIFRV